jgi:hypothetical protein
MWWEEKVREDEEDSCEGDDEPYAGETRTRDARSFFSVGCHERVSLTRRGDA